MLPRPAPAIGWACSLLLLATAPALADEAAPTPSVAAPASAPTVDDELKKLQGPLNEDALSVKSVLWMFAAMGFVIATIYITLNHGLRRLMGVRAVGAGSVVQLLERIPLDQKSTVYVLRAAGEYLVVGGTDGGLRLLHKLDPQQVEELEAKARAQGQAMSPFLQKLLFRKGGTPPPSA